MNKFILLLSLIGICFSANAQEHFTNENLSTSTSKLNPLPAPVLKGVVRTSDGKPAAGVNVILKETNFAAITNEAGEYFFYQVPDGRYTLVISFTGLKTIESPVEIKKAELAAKDFVLYENKIELQEIIVAYQQNSNERKVALGKASIKPMDLPQSIATIGESIMKDQQVQRLSDVVKNVNGVYLSTTRASTQESFSARGYSFSSTNMFRNGSRVNTGAMPEMSSLQSVEVLKGSAAILYGNVSPGGVLNMITKKPSFKFGGELSLRAGSYNLWKPAVDIYGPISSRIAYRINGTYESADSYRDQVSSTRYFINPSFLFKLSNKTELIIEGDYLNHEFTPDFGIGSLNNTVIPQVDRSAFMGTGWQYNTSQQTSTSATLNHQLNSLWNINSVISYQIFDRDYFSVERIQAKANGDWGRPLGRTNSLENYYTGQVNLNGKFKIGKINNNLLAGVDADHYITNSFAYDIQGKIYDSINLLDPNKFVPRTDIPVANKVSKAHTPVSRIGAYVQDLISISAKLKVLAGVRWSQQHSSAVTTTYLQKDSVARGTAKTDDAFSPRVGVVYRIKPNISAFASYSNSFAINSGVDIYDNALPPSIIDQYELGIKNIFLKGKLTVNVTAYKIINNNLSQTALFDRNGNPNSNSKYKELTGQTTSNGIELDVTGNVVKGLSLIAGYSYNDMRYTKTAEKTGAYIEGDRLVNIPAHTANGSAFYTFASGKLKGLKLGAGAFYVGKRYGGWNNTQGQSQQYSRMIPVKAFTTLDFSAGYTFNRISAMAKLSNIANTLNYYVHENYSINPIAPRSFTATVSYKF